MGGFSAVIENPPYVRAERMESQDRTYFMSEFYAKGRFDLYSIFCEFNLSITKFGGYISHVTPSAICFKSNAQGARDRILSESTITCIFDGTGRKMFPGASVSVVAITLRRGISAEPYSVLNNDFSIRGRIEPDACELLGGVFPLSFDEEIMSKWISVMRDCQTIGESFTVLNGLVGHHPKTGEGVARLVSNHDEIPEAKPYVEAKELDYHDIFPTNSRYISYLADEMHRPRSEVVFECEKVMIPAIQERDFLIAYLDVNHLYCNHTMILAIPKNDGCSPFKLFCWLRTSHVIEFLKHVRLVGNSINPADIRAIPYPEVLLNELPDYDTSNLSIEICNEITAIIEERFTGVV